MAKDRTTPSRLTSTSGEGLTTAADLGHTRVGESVIIMGRDVTLGRHEAEPIIHVGVIEAIHINAQRVRVVLIREGLRYNSTRVIEVTQ